MDPLLPEQEKQLKTWASERDLILSELSNLKNEKELLVKKNKELSDSNTEIQTTINQSIGRMVELDKEEKLYMEIVDVKIPQLESQKSILETEITGFQKEISYLEFQKGGLVKDIEFLIKTQSEVFDRTGILEKVVDHVTKVNSSNLKELEDASLQMIAKAKDILELSDSQYKAHTEVLREIPRLFVELQKKTLIRQKI